MSQLANNLSSKKLVCNNSYLPLPINLEVVTAEVYSCPVINSALGYKCLANNSTSQPCDFSRSTNGFSFDKID